MRAEFDIAAETILHNIDIDYILKDEYWKLFFEELKLSQDGN